MLSLKASEIKCTTCYQSYISIYLNLVNINIMCKPNKKGSATRIKLKCQVNVVVINMAFKTFNNRGKVFV